MTAAGWSAPLLEFSRGTLFRSAGRRGGAGTPQPGLEGLPGKSAVWRAVCRGGPAPSRRRPAVTGGRRARHRQTQPRPGRLRPHPPPARVSVLDCAHEPVEGVAAWSVPGPDPPRSGGRLPSSVTLRRSGPSRPPPFGAPSTNACAAGVRVFATLTTTAGIRRECLALVERFAAGRVEVPAATPTPRGHPRHRRRRSFAVMTTPTTSPSEFRRPAGPYAGRLAPEHSAARECGAGGALQPLGAGDRIWPTFPAT